MKNHTLRQRVLAETRSVRADTAWSLTVVTLLSASGLVFRVGERFNSGETQDEGPGGLRKYLLREAQYGDEPGLSANPFIGPGLLGPEVGPSSQFMRI